MTKDITGAPTTRTADSFRTRHTRRHGCQPHIALSRNTLRLKARKNPSAGVVSQNSSIVDFACFSAKLYLDDEALWLLDPFPSSLQDEFTFASLPDTGVSG